jgi:hypothetical protein
MPHLPSLSKGEPMKTPLAAWLVCIFAGLLYTDIGIAQTPTVVFERIINDDTRPIMSLSSGSGSYSIFADPGASGGGSNNDGLNPHHWQTGSETIYTHSDEVGEDFVDAGWDCSNIIQINPDHQVLFSITGELIFATWNAASANAVSEIEHGVTLQGNWNSDSLPYGSLYRIVDPDPEDEFEPPETIVVEAYFEALWGFPITSSGGGYVEYTWQAGASIKTPDSSDSLGVGIDELGNVFLGDEQIGWIDTSGDGVSIPFEFEVVEDEVIEIEYYSDIFFYSVASDGSVTGDGGISWGLFLTLPTE